MTPATLSAADALRRDTGGAVFDPDTGGAIGPPAEEDAPGIEELILHGSKASAKLRGAITQADLDETIDGPSTFTLGLNDPEDKLVRDPLLKTAVKVEVLGNTYVLVKVSSKPPALTLTFEDEAVAALRKHDDPMKADRAKVTRAEFILRMVREVKDPHIGFHAPELHKRQKIAPFTVPGPVTSTTSTAGIPGIPGSRSRSHAPGFPAGIRLRGKEGYLGFAQLRNAAIALGVCARLHAADSAVLALLEACIVEAPDFNNPSGGDGSSSGILQVTAPTAAAYHVNPRDVAQVCAVFLLRGFTGRGGAIALARRGISDGVIAQMCQGSAFPSRYAQYRSEALAIARAYRGGATVTGMAGVGGSPGTSTSATTRSVAKRYEFQRGQNGKKEDSWAASGRLAEEVKWRRFMRRGVLWYVSEDYLVERPPKADLTRESQGVLGLDFDYDTGKNAQRASLTIHAGEWFALPGDRINLDELGVADGHWLVVSSKRSLFSPNVQVELQTRTKALPEPAPEIETQTTTSTGSTKGSVPTQNVPGGAGDTGSAPAAVRRAWLAARAIDRRHYPYKWGGGHGTWSGPYDCSGAVSAVLHAAGLLSRTMVSGEFMSYGSPGPGRWISIFANSTHVFMAFKFGGQAHYWGTSQSNPGGGAGFHGPRSGSGFREVHPTGY